MKKLLVILFALTFTVGAFAQKWTRNYTVPSVSTYFNAVLSPGTVIINTATNGQYLVTSLVGTQNNITNGVSGGKIVALSYTTASGYVDTTNAQNIGGVKNFKVAPKMTIGSGGNNIGIGYNVFNSLTTGLNNLAFSDLTLDNVTSGGQNIGAGAGALTAVTSGGNNIGIGVAAVGATTTASSNVGIGTGAVGLATGGTNVGVGAAALYGVLSGSGNIGLGNYAGPAGSTSTASNKLYISNKVGGLDTAIIYGSMGATAAASTLQFNAATSVEDTLRIKKAAIVSDTKYMYWGRAGAASPYILGDGRTLSLFSGTNSTAGKISIEYNRIGIGLSGSGFYVNSNTISGNCSAPTIGTIALPMDTVRVKHLKMTACTASDTATKHVGMYVIGTQLYYCNGTYYYKVTYAN